MRYNNLLKICFVRNAQKSLGVILPQEHSR